jgi:hypothetical protein
VAHNGGVVVLLARRRVVRRRERLPHELLKKVWESELSGIAYQSFIHVGYLLSAWLRFLGIICGVFGFPCYLRTTCPESRLGSFQLITRFAPYLRLMKAIV